jgi:hypothetical protein
MDQMYQSLKRLRRFIASRDGDCLKKPYATRAEAVAFARHVRLHKGIPSEIYQCWCGKWHLASKRGITNA